MSLKIGVSTDWNEGLSSYIKNHFFAVVSTVNVELQPVSAMIYYASREGNELFFVTKAESRKVANMRANPQISLLIPDMARMSTLELEGEVVLNEDSGDMLKWIKEIVDITKRESVDGWLPLLQTDTVGLLLVQFKPERWILAEYDQWYPGEKRL